MKKALQYTRTILRSSWEKSPKNSHHLKEGELYKEAKGLKAKEKRKEQDQPAMTSLQVNIMASVARPQKSGRKDTQEATQNFILRIKYSWDEVDPLKHLLFFSFQIV